MSEARAIDVSTAPSGPSVAGFVLEAGDGPIAFPDAELLFGGDYSRSGADLLVIGRDGSSARIVDYFLTDKPATLVAPNGGMVTGDTAELLAGPSFAGQYAQAGQAAASAGKVIGRVEVLEGSATVQRTDGTVVQLKVGDLVHEGDVVQTGADSQLGLAFKDGTIFTMSADARMVLNSFVYDPNGANNSMLFNLLEGSFQSFAGQIAPTGDMRIQTPVSTMGIRGTEWHLSIKTEAGTVVELTITVDRNGHIGRVVVYDPNDPTRIIGEIADVDNKLIIGLATGEVITVPKTAEDEEIEQAFSQLIALAYSSYQNNPNIDGTNGTQSPDQDQQPGTQQEGSIEGTLENVLAAALGTDLAQIVLAMLQSASQQEGTTFDTTGVGGDQGGGEQIFSFVLEEITDTTPEQPLAPTPTGATEGNDVLQGDDGANFLQGLGGDDVLSGLGGDDFLSGGDGNDTLFGGDGDDALFGGAGDDVIDGGSGNDYIDGEGGNDTLAGGTGSDTVLGGEGNDVIDGGEGNDYLVGGAGNDTVAGGAGNDTLVAGEGEGDDSYDGGPGTDTITFTSTSLGITVNLANGTASGPEIGNDVLANIENVIGGSGSDSITGDGNANVLRGGAGNDTLNGGAGNDQLFGESGNDTFVAAAGDGDDAYDGGIGTDTITYAGIAGAVTVNLAAGTATGAAGNDTLVGIENVTGGEGGDNITGDGSANVLRGGGGDDTLNGGAGNDQVFGDAGNDTFIATAGDGDDAYDGGGGTDTITYAGVAGAVTVNLAAGTATGAAGNDTLVGIENVIGGEGNDVITGDGNANVLRGGAGNDTLNGGAGNDQVFGDAGNDTFIATAGDGDDAYDGGAGSDTINYTGVAGAVIVSLVAGTATGAAGNDTLVGIENVIGGEGNDVITGDANANVLRGGSGNDIITAGAGNDAVFGDAGNDLFVATIGDGNDSYDGGSGSDTITFANTTQGVQVNLSNQTGFGVPVNTAIGAEIGTDSLTSIENVIGGSGNDNIIGNAAANMLSGGDGNDTLRGGAGNDVIHGDAGDDELFGGAGIDQVFGDAGNDILHAGNEDTANDVYDGGADIDTILFNSTTQGVNVNLSGQAVQVGQTNLAANTASGAEIGTDTVLNVENATGGSGNDIIVGTSGDNVLRGGAGNDTLVANGGNDQLFGEGDDDTFIVTSDGGWTVDGGQGVDTLRVTGAPPEGFVPVAASNIEIVDLNATDDYEIFLTAEEVFNLTGVQQGQRILRVLGDGDTISVSNDFTGHPDGEWVETGGGEDAFGAYITYEYIAGGNTLVTVNVQTTVEVITGQYVQDEFNTVAYDNNDGTVNWSTNWIEIGDDGLANGGEIFVSHDPVVAEANDLQLTLTDDDDEVDSDDTIERSVDLSAAQSATLTFDYRRVNLDPNDEIKVYISSDGQTFDQIGSITGSELDTTDPAYQTFTFQIPAQYISATTTIRFGIGDDVSDGEIVYVDNVTITFDPKPAQIPATADLSAVVATGSIGGLTGFAVVDGNANGVGYSVSSAGDVNGDGFEDFVVGAPGSDLGKGAAWLVFGDGTPLGGLNSLSDLANSGRAVSFASPNQPYGESFGASVSGLGDVNGDGLADFAVAEPSDAYDPVYVFYGHQTNPGLGFQILHSTSIYDVTTMVGGAGDFNGDGINDIGVVVEAGYGSLNGDVFAVIFGDPDRSANVDLDYLQSSDGILFTPEGSVTHASIRSAGDINGDGVDDLIIGTPKYGNYAGKVYVVYGGQDLGGAPDLADVGAQNGIAGFTLTGESALDLAGYAVASAGDINGDGFDDIIIGAKYAGAGEGAAYIIYGGQNLNGNYDLSQVGNTIAGFKITGENSDDRFGASVASAGDINGDGFDDIVIGASRYGTYDNGAAYVVYGGQDFDDLSNNGVIAAADIGTSVQGIKLVGNEGEYVGHSVSSAGDVNGDGFDDLLIGGAYSYYGTFSDGVSYVVYGGNLTGAVTHQATAAVPDIAGTTGDDVMIGTAEANSIVTNGGGDVVHAGAGDDLIAISDANFLRIDGGTGQDTLKLAAPENAQSAGFDLDLTNLSNLQIQSIEAIDMRDGGINTLTLNVQDLFDLSETSNDLFNAWAINSGSTVSTANNLIVYGGDQGSNPGDDGDTVVLVDDAAGTWSQQPAVSNANVDGSGATFDIYNYTASGSGEILASIAVQTETQVQHVPAV